MIQIGVSLAMDVLCETPRSDAQRDLLSHGGIAGLLQALSEAGASCVELRTVNDKETEARVRRALQAVWEAGLTATIHGVLKEETADAKAFLDKIQPVFERQRRVTVTLHPIRQYATIEENRNATIRALKAYASLTVGSGITFALENNRMKAPGDLLVSPSGVLSILDEAQLPCVGACWDAGHLYSDHRAYPLDAPSALPDVRFAARAVHTHIHDLADRTHYPLGRGTLPLADVIELLARTGYDGVLNFEPEPERWHGLYPDALGEYTRSIRRLSSEAARAWDRLIILGTCAGTEPMPGRHHCSFCVAHRGRLYWFDAGEGCAYTASMLGLDLQKIHAVFLTHSHMDHIGGLGNLLWTVRKLDEMKHGRQGLPLSLYSPEPVVWSALRSLLSVTEGSFQCRFPINETTVQDGLVFSEEGFRVTALHNAHLPAREDGTHRSFSYLIEANGLRIVFAGDVRHVSEIAPLLDGADVLLAETGHHLPEAVVRELVGLGLCPPKLMFIHHGRAILEKGEAAVARARESYPGEIIVLNDGDSFALQEGFPMAEVNPTLAPD